MLKLKQIYQELSSRKLLVKTNQENSSLFVADFCTDTRVLLSFSESVCFFALKANSTKSKSGENFIEEAISKGVKLVFLEEQARWQTLCQEFPQIVFVLVKDTLKSYQATARVYLNKLLADGSLKKIIAITGSNGKTTCKELVASLLEQKYELVKTKLNENNELGVPKTIFRANQQTEILILEFGMRGLGQIRELSELVEPDYEIVTNVGTAHLEILETPEKIAQAKAEIFYFNPKTNTKTFFPKEQSSKLDYWIKQTKKRAPKKLFFEISNPQIKKLALSADFKEQAYFYYQGIEYRFASLKEKVLELACIAIELAKDLKLSKKELQAGLDRFSFWEKRGSLEKISKNLIVFDESYNSSLESILVLADYLASYQDLLKKDHATQNIKIETILVLGEILELGKDFESLVLASFFLWQARVDRIVLVGKKYCFLKQRKKVAYFREKEELKLTEQFTEKNKLYLIGLKASRALKFESLIERH